MGILGSLSSLARYYAIRKLHDKGLIDSESVLALESEDSGDRNFLQECVTSGMFRAQSSLQTHEMGLISDEALLSNIGVIHDINPWELFCLYNQVHDMGILSDEEFLFKIGLVG